VAGSGTKESRVRGSVWRLGYGLYDRGGRLQFPQGKIYLPLLRNIQTGETWRCREFHTLHLCSAEVKNFAATFQTFHVSSR
jgi:hypothetical protein